MAELCSRRFWASASRSREGLRAVDGGPVLALRSAAQKLGGLRRASLSFEANCAATRMKPALPPLRSPDVDVEIQTAAASFLDSLGADGSVLEVICFPSAVRNIRTGGSETENSNVDGIEN